MVLTLLTFQTYPINLCTEITVMDCQHNLTLPFPFLTSVSFECWKDYLHSVPSRVYGASSYALFFFVSLYFQSTHLNPLLEEQLLFQSVYVIPVALGFKMPPMYMGIKTQGIIIISVVCY